VHPFIEAERVAGSSVTECCSLLEVSKAAFYARRSPIPTQKQLSDNELTTTIREIHATSKGTYGVPRVRAELKNRGIAYGRRRVGTLMRRAGLEGRCKKRFRVTTTPDETMGHSIDLVKREFATGPDVDRRYVGDVTYIGTWEGWAYLATVIDLSSRRVVGWSLSASLKTDLVSDALKMAVAHRRPARGVLFHSDRGCQYTSRDFKKLARLNSVVLSVGRRGDCFDNAVAESFFATIKRELIETRAWQVACRRCLPPFATLFEQVQNDKI
jgi:putative transposase